MHAARPVSICRFRAIPVNEITSDDLHFLVNMANLATSRLSVVVVISRYFWWIAIRNVQKSQKPQDKHPYPRFVSRTHHERPWCIGFHIKLYMLSHIGLGCWILYQYHVRSWQIHEVRSTKSRLLSNMVKRQIYNYNN